jgi:hypothetical protein
MLLFVSPTETFNYKHSKNIHFSANLGFLYKKKHIIVSSMLFIISMKRIIVSSLLFIVSMKRIIVSSMLFIISMKGIIVSSMLFIASMKRVKVSMIRFILTKNRFIEAEMFSDISAKDMSAARNKRDDRNAKGFISEAYKTMCCHCQI